MAVLAVVGVLVAVLLLLVWVHVRQVLSRSPNAPWRKGTKIPFFGSTLIVLANLDRLFDWVRELVFLTCL